MHLRSLVSEDSAVSPVIGVILMVAITVVLAAVIGTFVLGISDQFTDTAPNANFQFDYDGDAEVLTVTHDGGDGIEEDELFVDGSEWAGESDDDGLVRAGHSHEENGVGADDTVRVTWQSADGDQSSTIAVWNG